MTPAKTRRSRRTLSLFPLLLSLTAPAALAAPIGFVSSVDGLVEIQHSGYANWATVSLDADISMGDTIVTERDSFAKVLLVDDTTLFVGEETELLIDKLVVGDLATQERSVLKQLRGQVRARVGKAFGGTTRLEIHTPTAIVGVRGSTMEVRVRGPVGSRETLVRNVEGSLFVKGRDAQGNLVYPPIGLCSRILEGRAPEPPMPCPADFEPIEVTTPHAVTQAAATPLILPGGVAAGGTSVVFDVQPQAIVDPLGEIAEAEPIFDPSDGPLLDPPPIEPPPIEPPPTEPPPIFDDPDVVELP